MYHNRGSHRFIIVFSSNFICHIHTSIKEKKLKFINSNVCALELMTIKICKYNLNKGLSGVHVKFYSSPMIMNKINIESK